MKNKGGIIALAIIILGLCTYYLSFTFIAKSIDKKADAYAQTVEGEGSFYQKKNQYLDSIQDIEIALGNTYSEIKAKELNLGLDLQGGMHVTLEIDPAEILKALADKKAIDPQFKDILSKASKTEARADERFVDIFYKQFQETAKGKKLTTFFANVANKSKGIDFNSTDSEVIEILHKEVMGAIDRSDQIIRTRIDKFGVAQPNIQRIEGTGRIMVELPGVDNPARVRKLLAGVAKLEFWEVWETNEIIENLQNINNFLIKEELAKTATGDITPPSADLGVDSTTSINTAEKPFKIDPLTGDTTYTNSVAEAVDTSKVKEEEKTTQENQSSDLFKLNQPNRGGMAYLAKDTARINAILRNSDVQALLPSNLKFLWSAKSISDEKSIFALHAIKNSISGKAPMSGEVVSDARHEVTQDGNSISMRMDEAGKTTWKNLTGRNIGRRVAIVLDNRVYSAPVVQAEITGGVSSITGDFSSEEAGDLANILKAGKLPAPINIVQETVVGPSLGKVAQSQGIISIAAGLLIVVLFMVAYYSKGGIVANIALVFNLLFIIGILVQLHASLSLPGIAGIVLTIGMSIDANVLIFERIREELAKGLKMGAAIEEGYQKAFWTIFDSNLTTFITGVFLFVFGAGPIKGFATTLMVGIACSFFTAVYVTRVIVSWMTKDGKNATAMSFSTPFSKNLLSGLNFNFMSKRKTAYIASATVIIIGLGLLFTKGLNLGVDFSGGHSYVVQFSEPVVPSDIEPELEKSFEGSGVEVKTFGTDNALKITTTYLVDDESAEADIKIKNALVGGIEGFTGLKFQEDYKAELGDKNFTIARGDKVGGSIADDIRSSSRTAVIFSLGALFLYILVRFRKWQFGLGAVAALLHDTLVVFSMFAIANVIGISFEIDQVFVAAMLTVIGYSINDTVVVFDRIREYLGFEENASLTTEALFDKSINSTLSRTLITSVTTLLVVIILFIFGGEVLRGFSFALLIGILVGTYSSIFIASPVVVDTWEKEKELEKVKVKESTKA